MAQHDYIISNGTGASVRSDLNGALGATVSNNSGATEPATMYAYQWWADTTTGLLKLRNSANNAWITIRQLDGEFSTVPVENGSAAAPSIFFKDSGTDTGLFSPGADQVAISTGGTLRLTSSTTAISSALPVDVPLGAAATPSLTFTGDLNTGIFSSGADAVDITTGGTRRFGISSAGELTAYGGNLTLNTQGDLRFADADSSHYVALQAPATVTSNVTFTLPSADGTADQVLKTDGSGALGWVTLGPPGSVIWYAANAAPTGYLKANGAAVSRSTYAALFSAIGTTFGVGDGSTTFNLPDLRGEFIRGWDDGRGVDSGRTFGSAQAQAIQSHTHSGVVGVGVNGSVGVTGGIIGVQSDGVTLAIGSTGGTETRPRNIALLACIKF